MNTKEMIASIVTAMMVMTMFASSAMAATINVDGDGSDWNSEWKINPAPAATLDRYEDAALMLEDHTLVAVTIYGYDLKDVWQHYDSGTDTMYWRYDVWWDVPGDLDGDSNPDGPTSLPPGDLLGVGLYEHYTLIVNSGTANELRLILSDNVLVDSTGLPVNILDAKEGRAPTPLGDRCIEFSLNNAKTYMDPGDYTVYGAAGGSQDLPGEDRLDVTFHVTCEFEFEFEQACCKRMAFSGTATSNNMINHTWDFGDGESLTVDGSPNGKDPVIHQYNDCGWYTATLSGWYGNGGYVTQSSSAPQSVYVNCGPTAKATANHTIIEANVPTSVKFTGSASTADGPPIDTYEWSFSDGGSATGAVVTKTVTLGPQQTLDATLTVNDTHCESSKTVTVGSKLPPPQEPPSDVPILTPTGMVALIGMLCIVGAGRILTKGRRS